MKIILTLELKRNTKKKSPAPQKPAVQSNSKTAVIINQK